MKKSRLPAFCTCFCLCASFVVHAQSFQKAGHQVSVPTVTSCQTILTDGQLDVEEWSDAEKILLDASDSCFLYVKQAQNFIFIAVKAPFRMLPYVDLFFDFGDGLVHNLHSSSKIGERILADTSWNDQQPAFHFGNSDQWYANEQRFDRLKALELLKANPDRDKNTMQWETNFYYNGFEYILKKSRFNKKKWKCRIEVKTGMPGYGNIYYPNLSERKNSATWSEWLF